jgi:hypothetical protein
MPKTRMPGKRLIAAIASTCLLAATLPLPAHAALIGTDKILHTDGAARAKIQSWVARDDVARVLVQNGVDPSQVRARVAALSDDEAKDFASRIDRLPAGGDVLGILFAIFIILLVTDILGLTKVFPFTRPVR